MASKSGSCIELLIAGYVREEEEQLELDMPVSRGIIQIMYQLYPELLFTFGDFSRDYFMLNDDKTILKGNNESCDGRLAYADLKEYNNIGFNKGIHFWSIAYPHAMCYASIGVTTEKNDKLINECVGDWEDQFDEEHQGQNDNLWVDCPNWIINGYNSYFEVDHRSGGYSKGDIVTMKLDCNDWIVTYYLNEKKYKENDIEPDKSYFMAVVACGRVNNTEFEVVETPDYLQINL